MPTEPTSWLARLSRRLLLQGVVSTASAAAIIATNPSPGRAVVKISQRAVNYQDHPDGDKSCDKCAQFQPPNACKMVDGSISPQGSCRIFTPNRQALGRPIAFASTA